MSFIYRDYRYLDYSNRRYLKKPNGFPFNSKTQRSDIIVDYDIPGPGAYDSTSHSIKHKMSKYQNRFYHSRPRLNPLEPDTQSDTNKSIRNHIGPGGYQLLSSERRSRTKRLEQLRLLNSKRFSNIFYHNKKATTQHKTNKSNKSNQLMSLLLTGDNNMIHIDRDKDKESNRDIDSNHMCTEHIKIQDELKDKHVVGMHHQDNDKDKDDNNNKTPLGNAKEIENNERSTAGISSLILYNQLFKMKRFINHTLVNEKRKADILMKKMNEDNNIISGLGPGSYNTISRADFKRHPTLLQNFNSSDIRRFDYFTKGSVLSNNTPGPGAYFNDDKQKKRHFINKRMKHYSSDTKPKHSIGLVDKPKTLSYIIPSRSPGPGTYNLDIPLLIKKNSAYNDLCFSSSEKRFIESSDVLNDFPGPSEYFNNNSNTQEHHKPCINQIKSSLSNIQIETRRRLLNKTLPSNTACEPNEGIESSTSLYHKIYGSHKIPNNIIAPLCSNIPKPKLIGLSKSKSQRSITGLGPGEYFKEMSNDAQNTIKVHSPQYRFNQEPIGELFNINTLTKNLSQYRKESYFDWHKKSFNISKV